VSYFVQNTIKTSITNAIQCFQSINFLSINPKPPFSPAAFTSSQSLSRHVSNTSIAIQTDEPLTKNSQSIETCQNGVPKIHRWKLSLMARENR
jgi:hypothetical protein